jgi:hypothetical protein
MAIPALPWDGVMDRVINRLGITTRVRNRIDGKVYWIGTMRPLLGSTLEPWRARTWVTPSGPCGAPNRNAVLLQIDVFAEDDPMDLHIALEDVVARCPRSAWAAALPRDRAEAARTAARPLV